MGVEKDYLMRQLMMLFEVIQNILRFRKKGENEKAEEQIQYFYACLKIDEDLEKLSIEQLVDLLVQQKKLTNDHLELVAFVLKEQAGLLPDDDERIDLFRKSYFLLEKVERESTVFSMDRQMKMAELRAFLN